MPLVFVHGVNNRKGRPYDVDVAVKRRFFEAAFGDLTIDGRPLKDVCLVEEISFPYWGDLGATFAWNMESLPRFDGDTLGSADESPLQAVLATWEEIAPLTMDEPQPLLALARESFPAAVKLLAAALVQMGSDAAGATAEFIFRAEVYARENPRPEWLGVPTKDAGLIQHLSEAITSETDNETPTLGGLSAATDAAQTAANALRKGAQQIASTVVNRSGNYLSRRVLGSRRASLNALLGRFFGDVFYYFDGRGKEKAGAIPRCIGDALAAARRHEGPLVVIAHSLGGVITFDVLGHFRTDIQVDVLVTVGSQVSHFEELKLFHASDKSVPDTSRPHAGRPVNIRTWFNVYDPVDVFAYACEPVFDAVEDLPYDTGTHTIHAHNAYFEQDAFYDLLRGKLMS